MEYHAKLHCDHDRTHGTISIIAGTSSGIEPLFALAFVRHVLEGAHLLEVSPLFERMAKNAASTAWI